MNEPRSPEKVKSWTRLLKEAISRWSADQVTRLAAALAFYTIFSVAPLVLITIAIVGHFLGDEAANGLISSQIAGFLGPDKAKALEDIIAGARRSKDVGTASVIGTLTVLLGASAVVRELQSTLNQIFSVHGIPRGFWATMRRRVVSIGFVLGIGFLLLISLGAAAGVAAAGKFFADSLRLPEAALQGFNQLLSIGAITALFATMFRFLPDARLAWRDLWVGALFTAVLFTLGNAALGIYLGKSGPTSAYGAAGSLLAFLLWAYYCAQILYFGAEYTRAYALSRGHGIQRV